MDSRNAIASATAIVLSAFLAQAASAQTYPSKPIRIVVPVLVGVGADVFSRLLAPKLTESLGQPVIVENRAGASGTIGADMVAKAAPDGYTVGFITTGPMISQVLMQKKLPYDPFRDFTTIGPATETREFLLINPSRPIRSLRELIDHAKKNPGKLSYGSSGTGSFFHLVGESLARAADIDLLHVPYKGTTQAQQDAIGGTIDLVFSGAASSMPLVDAGKLRLLAALGATRYSRAPDIPTLGEVLPNVEKPGAWNAFWGPAGLPRAIVTRFNTEAMKAVNEPDVQKWIDSNAITVIATTPEQLLALQKKETAVWRNTLGALGMKPE